MRLGTLILSLSLATPVLAKGKGKKAAATATASDESEGKKTAPNPKALADLAGKFKWGMTPENISKIIIDQLTTKLQEQIQKETDVYQQDNLRKELAEELEKVKSSYIKFDGQKSGWDVSIVDKEFSHRNDESMMVYWEKDQRRFLFFWHDKLYKQFIAFNAEHPKFQGKTFDDFAKLIENRFGPAEMKFANLRTKDEQTLDHLEWAPSGDDELWAIDQSQFYGNFCLVLRQRSVVAQMGSKAHAPKANTNAIIDSVTTRDKNDTDANADIVDQITGTKPKGPPKAQ
jgi:hypothetical protein